MHHHFRFARKDKGYSHITPNNRSRIQVYEDARHTP